MKKLTYTDVRNMMDGIPCNGMQASYALGGLQVLVAAMVADLPKKKQDDFAQSIEALIARTKQVVA